VRRYTVHCPAIASRGAPMYLDLATLEARFQTVLREWSEVQSHDEKVQLAKVAKEIATEYRERIAEYKQALKPKSHAVHNL
jgi:hypothetical protein